MDGGGGYPYPMAPACAPPQRPGGRGVFFSRYASPLAATVPATLSRAWHRTTRRIGVKTAALLINQFGDLDAVLARAAEVKQPKRRGRLLEHAYQARISRELVTLRTDVPVPVPLAALAARAADPRAVLQFLRSQDFNRLIPRWELSEMTPQP